MFYFAGFPFDCACFLNLSLSSHLAHLLRGPGGGQISSHFSGYGNLVQTGAHLRAVKVIFSVDQLPPASVNRRHRTTMIMTRDKPVKGAFPVRYGRLCPAVCASCCAPAERCKHRVDEGYRAFDPAGPAKRMAVVYCLSPARVEIAAGTPARMNNPFRRDSRLRACATAQGSSAGTRSGWQEDWGRGLSNVPITAAHTRMTSA